MDIMISIAEMYLLKICNLAFVCYCRYRFIFEICIYILLQIWNVFYASIFMRSRFRFLFILLHGGWTHIYVCNWSAISGSFLFGMHCFQKSISDWSMGNGFCLTCFTSPQNVFPQNFASNTWSRYWVQVCIYVLLWFTSLCAEWGFLFK